MEEVGVDKIKIIEGGIFVDYRGRISHVNSLDMNEIERFYIIHQSDTSVVRAWHAHQFEKKWFYAVKGSFTTAFVKIDNWEKPSLDLKPEVYQLTAADSRILYVPEGYANGIKANEPDSILLVYSNKILSVALNDSWRYDKNMWMDWDVKDVNYKLIDTQRIIDYITSFPKGISVESIIQNSGADKLRVYPALFELEQSGWLEVLEREELGAPSVVRKRI